MLRHVDELPGGTLHPTDDALGGPHAMHRAPDAGAIPGKDAPRVVR